MIEAGLEGLANSIVKKSGAVTCCCMCFKAAQADERYAACTMRARGCNPISYATSPSLTTISSFLVGVDRLDDKVLKRGWIWREHTRQIIKTTQCRYTKNIINRLGPDLIGQHSEERIPSLLFRASH